MTSTLNVIVRFEVSQEDSKELISLINDFFEKEVKNFGGFVSFKLHSNDEGTVIINYATWQSKEHFAEFSSWAGLSSMSAKIRGFRPTADLVYEILP